MIHVKKTKRIFLLIAAFAALIMLVFALLPVFFPIMRHEDAVKRYVEGSIPLNTSWEKAHEIIEANEKWSILEEHTDVSIVRGKNSTQVRFSNKDDENDPNVTEVGNGIMIVYLGEYNLPLNTVVEANLDFSEGSLSYISVTKIIDSL